MQKKKLKHKKSLKLMFAISGVYNCYINIEIQLGEVIVLLCTHISTQFISCKQPQSTTTLV